MEISLAATYALAVIEFFGEIQLMRLRQFAFVAEKLAPAVDDFCAILGLEVCFKDPGVGKFGLENALMPLNGNLFEIVAPVAENTTAGRYLERRGGDGGYMLLFSCADALAERRRITAKGLRAVWQHDEADCVATHFHPADLPGAITSIDTMLPAHDWHAELADWKWAGPNWREHVRTDVSQALTAVEIQGDDPEALAARWADVLDRPQVTNANGAPEVLLDNARLRFVKDSDGRGLGISAIDILPQNRDAILAAAAARDLKLNENQVMICGVKVNLV